VPGERVLEWLLEPDQPSIRYLTLTQLLGKSETDSDVGEAKARIPSAGWVAEMLARRDPGGWWVRDAHPMSPKYVAMNWNLLALSDLGATRAIPEVRASCELWMKKSPLNGGGVGGMSNGHGHHCYTGNMTRALIRFGYGERPAGPQGARLAGPDRAPEGGLDLLELQGRARDGTDPRLVGRPKRLRRISPLEVDRRHEGLRRPRGRVLSRA
jgi:hypothetical protein